MRKRSFAAAFACCAALAGCATVAVDGHEMNPAYWTSDATSLKNEAAFLFQCPAEQIQLTLLETTPDVTGDIARVVGVTGCGDSAVYKRVDGRWFMDASRSSPPPPPPPG